TSSLPVLMGCLYQLRINGFQNNFWHFRHSKDEKDGLCLPCCVLGLLRLPLFSVSGLPDLKSGINGVPPIYVVPVGLTLAETLAANWIRVASLGVPSW